VLCDPLDLDKPWMHGISNEAKDFLRWMLNKWVWVWGGGCG
jgi:hypothetical protein